MKKFIFSFLTLVLVLCLSVVIITDKKEVSAYNGSTGNPPASGNYFELDQNYLDCNINKDLIDPIYISYTVSSSGSISYYFYSSNYNYSPVGYFFEAGYFDVYSTAGELQNTYALNEAIRLSDWGVSSPDASTIINKFYSRVRVRLEYSINPVVVTFVSSFGTLYIDSIAYTFPYSVTLPFGSTLDLSRYTALYYSQNFVGWDKTQAELTNIQSDITVNAIWQPKTFTVTFNLNGGTRTGGGELVQTVNYGSSATAPTVSRTGYTFSSWDNSFSYITSDITVNAQWQINTYTVTFNLNGGVITNGVNSVQSVNYGGSVLTPAVTRTGYTFTGWDKPFDNITSDLTVNALWSINSYTITFDLQGGSYSGSVPLTQTIQYGGSATVPDYHDITKENYFFWGWLNIDKASNVGQNATITVYWEQPVFDLLISFENSYFEDLSANKYTPVTITQLANTFKYNEGFFLNENSVLVFGDFVLDLGKRFVQWDIRFGTSPDISDTIDSTVSTNVDIFDYSTWQDFLNIDYYSLSNFDSNNNYYYLVFSMVTEDLLYTVNLNNYITGIKYNEDGTLKEFIYSSSSYSVKEGDFLATNNNPVHPLDYPGQFFAYWQDSQGNMIDIYHTNIFQDYDLTAVYVDRLFNVTFWNMFDKLGVYSYRGGIGTITPPDFSFKVGTTLLGWSDELNGAIVNLNTYPLTEDIDLYSITNFNSLTPDSNFDIPYQDCGSFDIACGLANAFVYFLNEFPLISNIVHLVLPISTLFTLFTEYFVVFEVLGVLYTLSLGILFVYFIFRLFK